MLGYHVILRLDDDRVIAPSRAERRRIARKLAEMSRKMHILCWKLADTHLHIVVLGKERPDELIRRLKIWFANAVRPGVPLEVQRNKPIRSQSHLESVFHYALSQDSHHGSEIDTWQDASSVVDTLGLRVLCPEIATRVSEHHPRLKRPSLLEHLGVEELDKGMHIEVLADAAMGAFGLDALTLRGDGARARRAAVAAVGGAARTADIARALGVEAAAVRRLATEGASAREMRAVRLQMALRVARPAVAEFVRERLAPTYGQVGAQ